jgi:excisionase family DNA binding protein
MAELTQEEILTPAEVGELLTVHPTTVLRLARKGVLPSFRIGKLWRFRRSEVNNALKGTLVILKKD